MRSSKPRVTTLPPLSHAFLKNDMMLPWVPLEAPFFDFVEPAAGAELAGFGFGFGAGFSSSENDSQTSSCLVTANSDVSLFLEI
jgi:hypothetical protein